MKYFGIDYNDFTEITRLFTERISETNGVARWGPRRAPAPIVWRPLTDLPLNNTVTEKYFVTCLI